MKMIKNSALLFGTILIALSGCANIQSSPLYSAWQNQAYAAYGMQSPGMSVNPYMNAVISSPTGYAYMPERGYISQPLTVSMPVSQAEQQYVASYYGLN